MTTLFSCPSSVVRRLFLAALVCFAFIADIATAQDRSLYWDSLTVHTTVDADGELHVTERHAMVFNGAWNGGERSFQLRSWQSLRFEGFSEIDAQTGAVTPWTRGDLDQIGEYRLADGKVLRWRNRLATDAPFDDARRIYELRYVISAALVPQGDGYLLEHDLAFPDRSAEIRAFDATVEIDPVWQPIESGGAMTFHRERVQPGESVFITMPLRYVGAGKPAAVAKEAVIPEEMAPWLRYALLTIVIAFVVLQTWALISRDRRNGRFEPHVPLERIDEAWLQANVFNRPPEEVGAAWDRETSASEVSALLARLVLEGKLKSEVRSAGFAFLKRETLHLELLCERSRLADHERLLIDALFVQGGRTTNTDIVHQHYSKSGFDPAALLRKPLEKRLPMIFANRAAVPAPSKWVTSISIVTGLACLILGGVPNTQTIPLALAALVALLLCYVIGVGFAFNYRKNVYQLPGRLARTLMCIAVLIAVFAFELALGQATLFQFQMLGLTLLALGLTNSLFNVMRSRDTAEALQLRRALASARLYFERELKSQSPKLKDEWFPYLLAFGLGPRIDRWFQAYGGADVSRHATLGAARTGSSHSSSSLGSKAWTGGGGTFGGAGASGSWAAAAGSIASGVAAESSRSGSGGRSGGGSSRSSGGGGGGGW